MAPWAAVGNRTNHTFKGLQLAPGAATFVSVIGRDVVGGIAVSVSRAVMVDDSRPHLGQVWGGRREARGPWVGRYQTIRWTGFDEDASGVESVWVGAITMAASTDAISRDPETSILDAVDWELLESADSGPAGAVERQYELGAYDGQSIRYAVRVRNGAGLYTVGFSDPIPVVLRAPIAGTVRDGANPSSELSISAGCSTIAATWGDFKSNVGLYYSVGIATRPLANEEAAT